MSDSSQCKEFWIAEIRHLRHDFLNHLQLISGMLQVGKPVERVVEYITELSASIKQIGRVFELPDPQFAALLARQLMLLISAGYQIETRIALTDSMSVKNPNTGMLQDVCELLCQAAEHFEAESRLLEVAVFLDQGCCRLDFALPYAETDFGFLLPQADALIEKYGQAVRMYNNGVARLTLNLSEKQSR